MKQSKTVYSSVHFVSYFLLKLCLCTGDHRGRRYCVSGCPSFRPIVVDPISQEQKGDRDHI